MMKMLRFLTEMEQSLQFTLLFRNGLNISAYSGFEFKFDGITPFALS